MEGINATPRFDITLVPGDQVVINTSGEKTEDGSRPRKKYFLTIDGRGYPILAAEEKAEKPKKKRG